MKDLKDYKELIENNPITIATINKFQKPNLSVAADVKVLDSDSIIISCNEMVNTQKNIQFNPNVCLTSFDKNWVGLRLLALQNSTLMANTMISAKIHSLQITK